MGVGLKIYLVFLNIDLYIFEIQQSYICNSNFDFLFNMATENGLLGESLMFV